MRRSIVLSLPVKLVFPAGACTIKNYGSVIYGLRSKLVCLFVQARVYLSEPKSLAYFEI